MSTLCDQRPGERERLIHIRQLRKLRGDLKIANCVLGIDDHDRAGQNMGLFEKKSMSFPKFAPTVIREKRHIVDLGLFGEALLGKRGINADRDELNHLVEPLIFLAEIMRLLFADFCVQRGYDTNDPDLPFALSLNDINQGEVRLSNFRVLQRIANFDTWS